MSRDRRRRPPYHRRDRLGFLPTMWLIVFGAILGAAVLMSTPKAHGDPGTYSDPTLYAASHANAVCQDIAGNDLTLAALNIINHSHLSSQQAGFVINLSVRAVCPQFWGLLEQFTGLTSPLIPVQLPRGVVA